MNADYPIAGQDDKFDSKELAEFLAGDGRVLLPMVNLIERAECAIDEVIDVLGRAAVEAVLLMSAEQVAGPRQQGKRGSDREVYWHGRQQGRVALSDRQMRVDKPRLRKKKPKAGEPSEVDIPAYEAMRKDGRLADRMLSIMMRGVSTRNYEQVLPELAEQAGMSKSQVSRETIEAGERVLKELMQRDFSDKDLLVIYLDGIDIGGHQVIGAVGVDSEGHKHVLGLCEGATENAEVVKGLLEDLVSRGVRADRRRLFVIDGAKALRKAIHLVYGKSHPVQRCRNHKLWNVLGHLPKDQHDQARATLKAAWKLEADEGIKKLEQYASWLDQEHPGAAGSVREGLSEMFTANRLDLPGKLRRCLVTTNVIDSTHSGVRQKSRRVTRWREGTMALRWAAVAFTETERNYRRIHGHQQLWMLKAELDKPIEDEQTMPYRKTG